MSDSLGRRLSRTLSVKRLSSSSFRIGADAHYDVRIRLDRIESIPVNNTTVFIHWKHIQEGDSKRVVATEYTASFESFTIALDTFLSSNGEGGYEPFLVHLGLFEDKLSSKFRPGTTTTTWKKIASCTIDLAKEIDSTMMPEKSLVIPMFIEKSDKKQAAKLFLTIFCTLPVSASDLIKKVIQVAPQQQQQQQNWMERTIYLCNHENFQRTAGIMREHMGERLEWERAVRSVCSPGFATKRCLIFWIATLLHMGLCPTDDGLVSDLISQCADRARRNLDSLPSLWALIDHEYIWKDDNARMTLAYSITDGLAVGGADEAKVIEAYKACSIPFRVLHEKK